MKPSREAFHAWAQENPGANLADARGAFPDVPETTLRRWFERRNEPPPSPSPGGRRGVAPVDELDPTRAEGLVAIVGDIHVVLRRKIAKIAAGDAPVDRDEAAGLLSLAKVASTLIADHPGLLRAVSGGTETPEAPAATEADVREALGLLDDADEDG